MDVWDPFFVECSQTFRNPMFPSDEELDWACWSKTLSTVRKIQGFAKTKTVSTGWWIHPFVTGQILCPLGKKYKDLLITQKFVQFHWTENTTICRGTQNYLMIRKSLDSISQHKMVQKVFLYIFWRKVPQKFLICFKRRKKWCEIFLTLKSPPPPPNSATFWQGLDVKIFTHSNYGKRED